MVYLLSLILGIVQALTEFLPISSSAHLILARIFLSFDAIDGLTFDVALHVGTLAAIVLYFRRDIASLAAGFFASLRGPDLAHDTWQRLAWWVVVACIPAALAGFLLEDAIETYLRNPYTIVVTLVLGGILFITVERAARQEGEVEALTLREAFLIGVAQALALIPGVSRSGITIVAGMTQKLTREQAARFSFLLGAPVIFGAGLKKGLDLLGMPLTGADVGILLSGMLSSAVFGWLVIRFLMRFLRDHRLDGFAYYRFALAAVVGLALMLGKL